MAMINALVKKSVDRLPGACSGIVMHYMRMLSSRAYRDRTGREDETFKRMGAPTVVRMGLFAGMRFLRTHGSQGGFIAKMDGNYELPVQEALRDLIHPQPACFVDIGAAEGYYAVGVARICPETQVVAFELERNLQYEIRRQGRQNRVTNLVVRGACTCTSLEAAIAHKNTIVLCDVEGHEDVLLDPSTVPSLKGCAMIVELHEEYAPGVTQHLSERFAGTHSFRVVKELDSAAIPAGAQLPAYVSEGRRNPGEWMVLVPRVV